MGKLWRRWSRALYWGAWRKAAVINSDSGYEKRDSGHKLEQKNSGWTSGTHFRMRIIIDWKRLQILPPLRFSRPECSKSWAICSEFSTGPRALPARRVTLWLYFFTKKPLTINLLLVLSRLDTSNVFSLPSQAVFHKPGCSFSPPDLLWVSPISLEGHRASGLTWWERFPRCLMKGQKRDSQLLHKSWTLTWDDYLKDNTQHRTVCTAWCFETRISVMSSLKLLRVHRVLP